MNKIYAEIDPNDPAYNNTFGLTKREAFAAMAMQGLIASDLNDTIDEEKIANIAVKCADALIERLNKETE